VPTTVPIRKAATPKKSTTKQITTYLKKQEHGLSVVPKKIDQFFRDLGKSL
jgi:hypothetical protein